MAKIKKEKKIKKKRFQNINKKRLAIFILVFVLTIGISLIGIMKYLDTKPVAVKKEVVTNNKIEEESDQYKELVTQVNGNKKTDGGLNYKFQAKTQPVTNSKKEFQTSEQFERNLMNLIQSGKADDVNQAAAIWTQNSGNYNFSNQENLTIAGLGHDIMIYQNYFNIVDGMDTNNLSSFQKDLGRRIKNDFKTPMTMTVIGSQLLPQGQKEFLMDDKSNILDYGYTGVKYLETKQYKSKEDISASTADLKQGNILEEIYKEFKDVNSVYEVHMNNKYNRESYAYVVEDSSGKLGVYGFYYKKPRTNDYTLGDYRKQIAEFGETDNATEEDITWYNFFNATPK